MGNIYQTQTLKKKVLALVITMFIISPAAWFTIVLACGLVNFQDWQHLLFQGAIVWVPYVLTCTALMLYLSNQWLKPIEEVLKNPDAPEAVKEKARKNISRFPIRLFIAEVIYGIYGGYSALTGYFVWTGQRPPMMDERFLSVEFSSHIVVLFVAIPFIFIISHFLNSALKVIGLSEQAATFTIKKQSLIGNFVPSGLAILSAALFYYGRTRYFGLAELVFISALIAICFGFNKIIARRTSIVVKEMLSKVKKIGQGDLRQEIEVNSADEFGLLAVGFNQMTDNLRKSRSELEASKLFSETILQSQIDMVMTCNMNRMITFVNKATCDTLGYQPEELLGKEISIIYFPEEYKSVLGLFKETFEKGFIRNRDVVFLTKDKKEIPAVYNTSVLKDPSGKLIGGLAVAHNMSEAQELISDLEKTGISLEGKAEELKATQAQLVQAGKMAAVGQLSAGVAHEINNPLSGILGYTQFILAKLGRPEFTVDDFKACQKYLEYIEKESQRCKQIVENLLTFSRKSSEKFESVDIKSTMETIFSILKHSLELQNIKLNIEYAPGLPCVFGNTNQLQQVFTNIIINAQQAMPEGGELIISVKIVEKDEKKKVAISFQDTGCGIPKESLERIFEPFFTTKQGMKSLGLGLSICYQIIQQHTGEILVESEVGKGSKFTVILPPC